MHYAHLVAPVSLAWRIIRYNVRAWLRAYKLFCLVVGVFFTPVKNIFDVLVLTFNTHGYISHSSAICSAVFLLNSLSVIYCGIAYNS